MRKIMCLLGRLVVVVSLSIAVFNGSYAGGAEIGNRDVEQVLSRLDREVAKRDVYKRLRVARIDSVRHDRRLSQPGSRQWFDCTMRMARDYSSFNNDSALYYYTQGLEKALSMGLDSLETEFRMRRAIYLSVGGYISDAVDEFEWWIRFVFPQPKSARIIRRPGRCFPIFRIIMTGSYRRMIIGITVLSRLKGICCLILTMVPWSIVCISGNISIRAGSMPEAGSCLKVWWKG